MVVVVGSVHSREDVGEEQVAVQTAGVTLTETYKNYASARYEPGTT